MALKKDDPERLILTGLEYLTEYNGYSFEMLPSSIQKRIKAQTITAYIIRGGTPDKVRTSIFTRINTGGLTLQPAEIKNSVYRGQAADLLKELAHSEEFLQATRKKINPSRMLDCEFVNRFLAFYLLGLEQYAGNLEDFLNDAMVRLQKEAKERLEVFRRDFLRAMKYANSIFGEAAFRCEKLLLKKDELNQKYTALLKDKDFVDIITNGTAKISNVKERYMKINKIFWEILG